MKIIYAKNNKKLGSVKKLKFLSLKKNIESKFSQIELYADLSIFANPKLFFFNKAKGVWEMIMAKSSWYFECKNRNKKRIITKRNIF